MRFWGRKKREDKVIVICPKCKGTSRAEQKESDGHYREGICIICNGMGVGFVSRSKVKELDLTSHE